jgi:acetyl esterase/lipase
MGCEGVGEVRGKALRACLVLLLVPVCSPAREARVLKKTYTYKTVGDVRIQADVFRSADHRVRPALVWIHGGALIMGSRQDVPRDLVDLCRAQGYALVSLDYRLAPEVKLPDIVSDIADAFAWLRNQGPGLLHIDPDKMVVAGGSAGGYLTMMAGTCIKPRPRALVAYWGYGDVDGSWYTEPSEYYLDNAARVNRETAYEAVGLRVLTGTDGANLGGRAQFYRYLRQHGLWTKEVTGFDPVSERSRLDPYCPVRNLRADYPPILMIHGTFDEDVPYEESAAMDRALTRLKVPHELVTVPGARHGLAGGDPELVQQAHARARAFIREHLR